MADPEILLVAGDGVTIGQEVAGLVVRANRARVVYRDDLADLGGPSLGAGMVAFNPLLNYPAGSVGEALASGGVGTPTNAPIVTITTTGQIFVKAANGGAIAPASTLLTATVVNIQAPTFEWQVDGVIQVGQTTATLTMASFAPTGSRMVKVTATGSEGETAFDVVSIYSVQEGSDAVSGGLENENQTVQCNSSGTPKVGSFPMASKMLAIRGAVILTAPAVTFSVVESIGIESAGTTVGASANVAIDAAGNVTIGQIAADYAQATFRATVGALQIDRTMTINKSFDGADGSSSGSSLELKSTGFAFVFNSPASSVSDSPMITLRALLFGIAGTAAFTATAYDVNNTSLGTITLGGTGNTRTLTAAQFNSLGANNTKYVAINAVLSGYSDDYTIHRTDNGSNALTMVFGNEHVTVPTDYAGLNGVFTNANTQWIRMYEGIVDVTNQWTFARADTNCTSLINGGAGPVSGTPTVNLAVSAMTADFSFVTITATKSGSPTQTKNFRLTKSKAGNPGPPGTGLPGAKGDSTRVAYALFLGNPPPSGSSVIVTGTPPSGLPQVNSWAFATAVTAWTQNTQVPAAGQALFMTTGVYIEATNSTTWTVPFLANLKVGQLSAIAADLGTITAGRITGSADIEIAGYAKINGGNSYLIEQFDSGVATSSSCAVVANTSKVQKYGIVGYSGELTGGAGLYGIGAGSEPGVLGSGTTFGVRGKSYSGVGVSGASQTSHGVSGVSYSNSGVSGISTTGIGVVGSSSSGYGVHGYCPGGWGVLATGGVQSRGVVQLEGTNSVIKFRPNADSNSGIGALIHNNGSALFIGRTAVNDAGGWASAWPIQMYFGGETLIANPAFNNLTITGGGSAGVTIPVSKPGTISTGYWIPLTVNGAPGDVLWFPRNAI